MQRQPLHEVHSIPKYQQVFDALSHDILTGRYKPSAKLPSEAALVQQFNTSRITIGRALRELSTRGLINRIAGSGTYVRGPEHSSSGMLFGLLIPDLGHTEIFEPICQGIASAPATSEHALLWGHAAPADSSPHAQALRLCNQYVDRKVAGVFFAPLERGELSEATNREVVARLENAGIPIVLLDRGFEPFPKRSRHDLVGIDNRLAAYSATAHLLQAGAPRVSFIGKKGGVATILARIAGYREALLARDIRQSAVHRFDSVNAKSVKNILAASTPGDGFICANDRIAGKFMLSALALGYRIPQDIRIASIDDVEYASMLPIALTTVHQPCREIGEAAMTAMLDRIAHPRQLARDILLECRIVVRKSCGAI